MNKNKLSAIYFALLCTAIMASCGAPKQTSFGNFVAKMEVKEPITGVCDNDNVIFMLPLSGNGQVAAKSPKTDAEIEADLNAKVLFLKDKTTYEDKGMVGLIINCKGEMVQCQIDNKTKSTELDSQIVAVFAELKTWTAGNINGKPYDTSVLYSFTIKDGKISLQ